MASAPEEEDIQIGEAPGDDLEAHVEGGPDHVGGLDHVEMDPGHVEGGLDHVGEDPGHEEGGPVRGVDLVDKDPAHEVAEADDQAA